MRLGQTPVPRQVAREDLSRSLYEVSVRLPNQTLLALYSSTLGPAISQAAQDQVWWFRRTEYLVKRPLTYQLGDWAGVYASLDKYGLQFEPGHDYSTVLMIEVLLEVGDRVDDTALHYVATRGSREVMSLALSLADVDTEDEETGVIIVSAAEVGNEETLAVLLEDGRIDPTYDGNLAVRYATSEGYIDCVKLLLADNRVDASAEHNEAIHDVIKYRFYDIFDLLLGNKRVIDYGLDQFDGFGLEQAILMRDEYFVRRIIEQLDSTSLYSASFKLSPTIGWAIALAAKIRDTNILKLVLELARDRIDDNSISVSLAQAKRRKYYDVVEILQSAL